MSSATLSVKGQVTIPKNVREKLGLHTGDRIEFVEMEQGVFKIVPSTHDVTELKGIIKKPEKVVSLETMEQAIKTKAGAKPWSD
jgi:AbrB family looped-hinge helix DNA binding protein